MELYIVTRKNALINNYYSLLVEKVIEKEKIVKIRDVSSKYNSLLGKLLLQFCFEKYYKNNNLKLNRNKYNKPYIMNSSKFFNLSHSKDKVILVVDNNPVGIDIEFIGSIDFSIVKKFFSFEEQLYLNSLKTKKNLGFFKLWTQKESFVKCFGKGFFHDIFDTNMVIDNKLVNYKSYKEDKYHFYNSVVENHFIISICSPIKNKSLYINYIDIDVLINWFT
ncbi:TPA: 4'-phosphopantetheinyl transferase superfamily protein [Staphylococcus aureus]